MSEPVVTHAGDVAEAIEREVVSSSGRNATSTASIGTRASIACAAMAIDRSISSIRIMPSMSALASGTVSTTRRTNARNRP